MIPFLDLKKQHELFREEIYSKLERVIYESSNFILGEEVDKFEKEFADYCGYRYGIGVNSGTDALKLALKAYDIGKGINDEVILPVNTAIPCAMAIKDAGAEVCFVDVNDNYLIDVNKIEEKINEKTKAIMPIHLYGRACEMDKILKIASKYNLRVIEDCCQAHGTRYSGQKVPIGDIGCFSFYPSKNLGVLGDGGMVVTDEEEVNNKIRLLRNYGQSTKYYADILGINSRLDEIQASVLRVKLKHLDEFNNKRRENAKMYNHFLQDVKKIKIPDYNPENIYHLYVIRVEDKDGKSRDGLMNCLKSKEIGTRIHYPIPLHLQKALSYLNHKEGDFPNAEKFAKEILSLPMYPELTKKEIYEVCKNVYDYFDYD
ncbi:MAG: DegT/DnrJ/EryC1/StrS family aminotransferase [Nanoarchaeota archaeon]